MSKKVEMTANPQVEGIESGLEGLEIETLELSEFLDDARFKEGDTIAKVMAASCTTCECCCSY